MLCYRKMLLPFHTVKNVHKSCQNNSLWIIQTQGLSNCDENCDSFVSSCLPSGFFLAQPRWFSTLFGKLDTLKMRESDEVSESESGRNISNGDQIVIAFIALTMFLCFAF